MKNVEILKLKGSEIRGTVPLDKAEKGPRIAQLSREVLADCAKGSVDERKKDALSRLRSEIEKRGGRVEVISRSDGTRKVDGEVQVAAGKDRVERRVCAGSGTTVVTYPKGLDEKVVQAASGYGMGVLSVSYRVDGNGNAMYIIRTNGSILCSEENLLNVAMALAGAAEIAEDMLRPKQSVLKLVELQKAA